MLNLSTADLMQLHINTLYGCTAEGHLQHVNEAGEPPAPLFYMGRTLHANFWRFRHDLPAAMMQELDALCRTEPLATDFTVPPLHSERIKAVLAEAQPLDAQREYRGPAYYVAEDLPQVTNSPATTVLITEANAELLRRDFAWALPLAQNQEILPIAATLHEGRAVSMCFCSRRPAQATEAGAETLVDFRGKGYATATVAAWAAAVRASGCLPMYSTSWENHASQAIARKLQMRFYGEDWSVR